MATAEITPKIPQDLTWDDLRAGVARLAKERGWHHGVPMVSIFDQGRRIVLAKGCPLADKHGHDIPVSMDGRPRVHVCSDADVNEAQDEPFTVNGWMTKPKLVAVGRYSKGAVVEKIDLTRERLDLLLRSALCQAGAVDADAELRAMVALYKRINRNQWDSYLLAGMFPETSKRSGVTYFFRKGRPTLALRIIPRPDGSGEDRHFLAALCTHPLAWYEQTFVGAYPPSDEVLANLLAVRADEHAFWKRAQQHALDDPMAGI
jgi:hypothetical protein